MLKTFAGMYWDLLGAQSRSEIVGAEGAVWALFPLVLMQTCARWGPPHSCRGYCPQCHITLRCIIVIDFECQLKTRNHDEAMMQRVKTD